MSKSKQTRETAKALVSPFFAWSNALLKGGEMVLDSMQAAARQAKSATVAVIPTLDAPAPGRSRRKKKAGAKAGRKVKAKSRR